MFKFFLKFLVVLVCMIGKLSAKIDDPPAYKSSSEINAATLSRLTDKSLYAKLKNIKISPSKAYLIKRTLWLRRNYEQSFCVHDVKSDDYEARQLCYNLDLENDKVGRSEIREFYNEALREKMYVAAARAGITIMRYSGMRGDYHTFEEMYKKLVDDIPKNANLSLLNIEMALGTFYALSNSQSVVVKGIKILQKIEKIYDENPRQFFGDYHYFALKYNLGILHYFKLNDTIMASRYFSQSYGHADLEPDTIVFHALTNFLNNRLTKEQIEKLNNLSYKDYRYANRVNFLECYRNYVFLKLSQDYDLSYCYTLDNNEQTDVILHLTNLLTEDEQVPETIKYKIESQFREFYNLRLSKLISNSVKKTIDLVELQHFRSENQRKEIELAESRLVAKEEENNKRLIILLSFIGFMTLGFSWWIHRKNMNLKILTEKQLHEDTALSLNKITRLINTINQAIVLVKDSSGNLDKSSIINEQTLQKIVGTEKVSNIFDSFFCRTDLTPEVIDTVKNFFQGFLGEDELSFALNYKSLPTVCRLGHIHAHIEYYPILDDSNLVAQILIAITDVSETKILRQRLEEYENQANILIELVEFGSQKASGLLRDLRRRLEEDFLPAKLQKATESDFRNYFHSIKGNCRVAGFKRIASQIHKIEGTINHANRAAFKAQYDKLIIIIQSYRETLEDKLKVDQQFCDPSTLLLLSEACQSITDISELKQRINELFEDHWFVSTADWQHEVCKIVEQISKNETKEIKLRLEGDFNNNVNLHRGVSARLNNILIHLINNSIAHGAPAQDNLTTYLSIKIGKNLTVYFWDNGTGLDLKKLSELSSHELSERELAKLIFNPTISTSTELSLISGRGVGMSAVEHLVREMGGDVDIELLRHSRQDRYRPFKIVINLPLDSTVKIVAESAS